MKKFALTLAAVVIALATAAPLHAQDTGGCENSPENPTAILALVGAAGAFGVHLKNRFRSR
jgi:XrtJ-associated TM-motif-TM protein